MDILKMIENGEPLTDSQILSSNCSMIDVIRAYENKTREAVAQYDKVVEQNKSLQGDLLKTNELHQKIKEFLTEMSNQDNRGTRFAYYYTIIDFNDNFVENDFGEYFYSPSDARVLKISDELQERFEDGEITLDEEDDFEDILNSISTGFEDDRINAWLELIVDGTVQRYENEPVSWTDGVFLTEKDAEQYLKKTDNHHSEKAYTYVDCMCKWGRTSQTEEFLSDLFKYFEVEIPPEGYYKKKKETECNSQE